MDKIIIIIITWIKKESPFIFTTTAKNRKKEKCWKLKTVSQKMFILFLIISLYLNLVLLLNVLLNLASFFFFLKKEHVSGGLTNNSCCLCRQQGRVEWMKEWMNGGKRTFTSNKRANSIFIHVTFHPVLVICF